MLAQNQKDLVETLRELNVPENSAVTILGAIETDEMTGELVDWILENSDKMTESIILEKVVEMVGREEPKK